MPIDPQAIPATRQISTSHFGTVRSELERRDNARRRRRALHGRGVDEDARRRKAARQHVQDVAQRGRRGRRDDADTLWKSRQWPLVFQGKRDFGGKLDLELFELRRRAPHAGFFQVLDVQLIVAARAS